MKTQINILAIVNIVLIAGIAITGYLLFQEEQKMTPNIVSGKLVYLKESSSPSDPAVGVYLKLILENPKYIRFDGKACIILIHNSTPDTGVQIENRTGNEIDGFVVDVEDKNGNGVIDTGDIFHIYGRNLKGYEITFCITGVNGNIHIKFESELTKKL